MGNRTLIIAEIVFFLGTVFAAIVIVNLVYFTKDGIMPVRNGFFCDDHSIMKPYSKSKELTHFSNILIAGIVASLAMILVIEMERYMLERRRRNDAEDFYTAQNDNVKCGPLKVPHWMIRMLHNMCALGTGTCLLEIAVAVIKVLYGRLRPHFLAVCKPNTTLYNCSHGYITGDVCTGDPALVKRARLSMPSGHTASAAYFAVFVVLCIEALACLRKYKVTKITIQVGVILLASIPAVERITTNAHHPSDVVVGLIMGVIFALAVGAKVLNFSTKSKTSHTEYQQISELSTMDDR